MFYFTNSILEILSAIGPITALFGYLILLLAVVCRGRHRVKEASIKYVDTPKRSATSTSAVESSFLAGKFLDERRSTFRHGKDFSTTDGITELIVYKGVHFAWIYFIRLCHLHGCEVEIRQVTEDRTSVLKTEDELVTFMRPEFYTREDDGSIRY